MSSTSDMGGSLATKSFITSPSRGVTPQHNLAAAYPHIAQLWDNDKNPIPAYQCAPSSNKKAWWICDKGHSYAATPNDLTSKKRVNDTSGCPYCSGRKILPGFNDLESQHPELAMQWDTQRNDRSPLEVAPGSSYRAWWLCDKGHSWQDSCNHRTATPPRGCPHCAGKRVAVNNPLSQDYPELAKQWDTERNALDPEFVSAGSHKKAWWICDKGHSWEASIKNRSAGRGCPYCAGKKVLIGYNDVATTHPYVTLSWRDDNVVSPQEVSAGSRKKVWWRCSFCHGSWSAEVYKVATQGTGCPYCSGNRVLPGFNDLATKHPDIAKLWDEEKNIASASSVAPGSNKMFWWRDDNGMSWQETPNEMVRKSNVNRLVPISETHPELISEWEYCSDGITPHDVSAGSHVVVTWKCERGHTWDAPIFARTYTSRKAQGCPYCSGRLAIPGETDLATTHPHIKGAFYPGTDKEFDLSTVSQGSGKRLEWKCSEGHGNITPVSTRVKWVDECPQCASRAVSSQEQELVNYLSSLLPDGEEIITNSRSIISPKELDIYIPSRGIAIEFNGIYWHTESQGKDCHYHQDKWLSCREKGIQLITVWEDQWRDSPEVVKSMLAHKLGASTGEHIYARNTIVKEVPLDHARNFCEAHHIQGFTQGSAYLGLYNHNDTLVAVSVWRKNGVRAYLERYCTSCIVVGGMGKLLAQGASWARLQGIQEIVTFSDHEVSNGGLYQKLGFTLDKELKPDYRYVVDGKRVHKFNYRLKRFRLDPTLDYHDGMTERELALLNRLERVWDCGKTRWVMEL